LEVVEFIINGMKFPTRRWDINDGVVATMDWLAKATVLG
jgi:hypothetical protein